MHSLKHIPGRVPGVLQSRWNAAAAMAIALGWSVQALAAPTFATQQPFATGTGPHAIATVDLNADGKLDLVVANQADNTLSILLNTTAAGAATPTFATQTTLATGTYPVAVAIADINGDGKPDLVVANAKSYTLSILLNTTPAGAAAPTFAAQQTVKTGVYPFSVAAADLDGDGKVDLVVANDGGTTVSIFRNTTASGAATASFDTTQSVTTGNQPAAVITADVNGDGKPDLIVANYISNTISVLLNTTQAGSTTLTFADQLALVSGASPNSLAVADINGDGKPDIVVVNSFSITVGVYLNTTPAGAAAASFAPAQTFTAGLAPTAVAVADIDGDGRPDLIAANQAGINASVLINTTATGATAATFATQLPFTTGVGPVDVIAADINFDGRPDLVVANNQAATASVLLNTTTFTGAYLDQHGITGSWFNPATGGQGIEFELYPDLIGSGQALLFGGWFTYDSAASGQRWYALSGPAKNSSSISQLGIYAGYAGNFAAAPNILPTQVGMATMHFSDCSSGALNYAFYDGRAGTVPLHRLTANITCGPNGDNGNAAGDYLLSGSWFDASTSGQGLLFDVNPTQNVLFATWYTYAPTGALIGGAASERWYTIQSAFVPGSHATAATPIYATSGGKFDDPTTATATQVGTATITFQSCSAATLAYSFDSGTNAGLSGTLHLTRTGPTPQGCTL